MVTANPISQANFLVKIHGITVGYFPRCAGGHVKTQRSRSYDGGDRIGTVLAGNRTLEDLVTGRDYDPARDEPVLRQLRPVAGRYRTTVSVQAVDANLAPIEAPRVYPNALLGDINEPEADAANGQTASRFELVWAVDDVI